MAEDLNTKNTGHLADDLRTIGIFSDLPKEALDWLAEKFKEIHLRSGEVFLQAGDPADTLFVLLEGEIRFQLSGAPDSPVYRVTSGNITGVLPYSRMTHYRGTGQAVVPTRGLTLNRSFFPEMLQRIPQLGERFVGLLSDRIRETTRVETQRDKMAALGKLSAGLAHELNNPAAAAQRATASLRETLETVRDSSIRLARHALSPEERETILRFEREAGEYKPKIPADPLAQSDREERVLSWLEKRQVPDAWKVAPVLADVGVEAPRLESLAAEVSEDVLNDALIRITSLISVLRLIGEIEQSTRRISDLVRAVKEYSHMDRPAMQETDVHQGLENTLTILGHQLKRGIRVVREYDKNLPLICAYGGQLNQIWTNLIDNAIEAMHGQGELRVRTARDIDRILVEICDSGPGIPADVLPHIFDPFFTTKGVGEGTGLGLDTACRIIRNHHGEIRVSSQPGDTRFQVYLPIDQPKEPAQEK
ncbi:MAG: cyclic nucleotide-binding domain-containing protein [Acidobacteria bacterium]|nr:MAG: cyclic nucleotide-binding domain-containing protein [Acidobacteriota bacterium]